MACPDPPKKHNLSEGRILEIIRSCPETNALQKKRRAQFRRLKRAAEADIWWKSYTEDGPTLEQVAARFDVCLLTVHKRFYKFGYPVKDYHKTKRARRRNNIVHLPHKGMVR